MALITVDTTRPLNLVALDYGIRFPQCKECDGCRAYTNSQNGAGSPYAFKALAFVGPNAPLSSPTVYVLMETLPSIFRDRNLKFIIYCIATECLACTAKSEAKNYPLTGHLYISNASK